MKRLTSNDINWGVAEYAVVHIETNNVLTYATEKPNECGNYYIVKKEQKAMSDSLVDISVSVCGDAPYNLRNKFKCSDPQPKSKQMKIVQAVNALKGMALNGATSGKFPIEIRKGLSLYLFAISLLRLGSHDETICTITEYNKCVKEMSEFSGANDFDDYRISVSVRNDMRTTFGDLGRFGDILTESLVDKVKYINSHPEPKKESKMQEYKYELVTDLDRDGIAKAMIDGEVFYNSIGSVSLGWCNGNFTYGNGGNFCVGGEFYRKVKVDWTDKLDGTIENAVICWVSDRVRKPSVLSNSGADLILTRDSNKIAPYVSPANDRWLHVIPLTKQELQVFLNNAPEQV